MLAQIGAVCVLGAMSPGPSLAVVLRNTVAGGRLRGVMTGLGHGIGFFFYALPAVSGLAAAMDASDAAARGSDRRPWPGRAGTHYAGPRRRFVPRLLAAALAALARRACRARRENK